MNITPGDIVTTYNPNKTVWGEKILWSVLSGQKVEKLQSYYRMMVHVDIQNKQRNH